MSYRNKTYVVFDGDNDIYSYGFMKGWKSNENMDFNFHDAHELRTLADRASEETVKRALRERFSNAKQVIAMIGENTKNLYRFVRWELDVALGLDLPIVAVNLNGLRYRDDDLCPRIIYDTYTVHVPFKAKIIQHALDSFPDECHRRESAATGPRHYPDDVYQRLGLND